jgi:hypothetical protein
LISPRKEANLLDLHCLGDSLKQKRVPREHPLADGGLGEGSALPQRDTETKRHINKNCCIAVRMVL